MNRVRLLLPIFFSIAFAAAPAARASETMLAPAGDAAGITAFGEPGISAAARSRSAAAARTTARTTALTSSTWAHRVSPTCGA
jgi:hypothetical protein